MPEDISRDVANQLIAEARDRLSEATGILHDGAYLSAQRGREQSDDEVAQLAEVVYRWTGKRFNHAPPVTEDDLKVLARNMREKLDAAMQSATECFCRLAPVAVRHGQDPRPFTAFVQLVSLNLAGLLKPDVSKVSPADMFTTKGFAYSTDVCENKLRGADHPHDALLKLEHAINARSTSQPPDTQDGNGAKGKGKKPGKAGKPKLSKTQKRGYDVLIRKYNARSKGLSKKEFCNGDSALIKKLENALAYKRTTDRRAKIKRANKSGANKPLSSVG